MSEVCERIGKAMEMLGRIVSLLDGLKSSARNPVFARRIDFILGEKNLEERAMLDNYGEECGLSLTRSGESPGVDIREAVEKIMDLEIEIRMLYADIYAMLDENDLPGRKMFYYFSRMELNHYQILEAELEVMERFEEEEEYWPQIKEVKK